MVEEMVEEDGGGGWCRRMVEGAPCGRRREEAGGAGAGVGWGAITAMPDASITEHASETTLAPTKTCVARPRRCVYAPGLEAWSHHVPDQPSKRPVCAALSEPPGGPGRCTTLRGPAGGQFGRSSWAAVSSSCLQHGCALSLVASEMSAVSSAGATPARKSAEICAMLVLMLTRSCCRSVLPR